MEAQRERQDGAPGPPASRGPRAQSGFRRQARQRRRFEPTGSGPDARLVEQHEDAAIGFLGLEVFVRPRQRVRRREFRRLLSAEAEQPWTIQPQQRRVIRQPSKQRRIAQQRREPRRRRTGRWTTLICRLKRTPPSKGLMSRTSCSIVIAVMTALGAGCKASNR